MKATLAQLAEKLRRMSQVMDAGAKRKAKSPRREERHLPAPDERGKKGKQRAAAVHSSQALFRICSLL